MADYVIDLSLLETKKSEFDSLKRDIDSLYSNFSNSYLNRLTGDIAKVSKNINSKMERLKKGYSNSSYWLNNYVNEMASLESKLGSFSSSTLSTPKTFSKSFDKIFNMNTLDSVISEIRKGLDYDYDTMAALQTGGRVIKDKFKASNGLVMEYYLYIPKFSNGQTEGLPLTCYLHGDSGYSHGVRSGSLPKLITKNGLNVPGMVLMPQSNRDRWWESPRNMNTAAELTEYIARKYKCDMNRISACGHSNGGCGVHHMVAAHPKLFSAYVSSAGATGKNKKFEAIGKNHVYSWGIHGNKDKNVAYSKSNGVAGKQTYERLARIFPEGTEFTTLKGRDHFIQDEVWTMKLSYKGVKQTPLQWLFNTKKWGK